MNTSVFNFLFIRNQLNCLRFFTSPSANKKICIVGSGPAGFYTAQYLLKNSVDTEVDIFEKLPVPFGLIRYGVAPDHPEIKVVTKAFTKVAEHHRCQFFGNVNVGRDVALTDLLNAYHAVILAFGASEDRELKIPGEDLQNVLSARKFVNWYNGHPDFVDLKVEMDAEVATVIGLGNVALDVARILLKRTDELKGTDIADYAMDALHRSRIKKVILVGRRGPLQATFTIKELREISKLKGVATKMDLKDFDGIPSILEELPRPKKRLVELLLNIARDGSGDADKTLEIKYFRSPKSVLPDDSGKVKAVVLGVNTVEGTGETSKVICTNEEEKIETGLVLRSVGYRSRSIDPQLPFDETNFVIPNEAGRVIGQDGLYCSGWVKTGPRGVIVSTMHGSEETGATILQDIKEKKCFFKDAQGSSSVLNLLKHRGIRVTLFDDWLKINEVEVLRGKMKGKPRDKICSYQEILKTAGAV